MYRMFGNLWRRLMRLKKQRLWHPESSGMRVVVNRSFVGRFFKPTHFATLSETIRSYKNEQCY